MVVLSADPINEQGDENGTMHRVGNHVYLFITLIYVSYLIHLFLTEILTQMYQLVEKDPDAAILWFWKAINGRDRVDSALKDMAVVMKQQNRAEEAVEAIRSFRHLCSKQAQESLDNLLIDLYKVPQLLLLI